MPMSRVVEALDYLESIGKPTYVRQVIVPGINDTEENAMRLGKLLSSYKCVKGLELLPFRRLCIEKYRELGIPFPLEDYPEGKRARCDELENIVIKEMAK